MKTAAIVVLYEPNDKEIEAVINKISLFDNVIVYDNSKHSHGNCFSIYNNCKYEYNGKNDGLAIAYNYALRFCNVNNIDWLFILDQDSSMNQNDILLLISSLEKTEEDVAIVCSFVKYKETDKVPTIEMETVEWTINSGSFLNVELLRSRNIWYDEYYYLDRLDRDFCMQVIRASLKIVRINTVVLHQQLGEKVNGKSVHSPLRNYYMARNRMYYNYKYYGIPKRWLLNIMQTVKHILWIVRSRTRVRANLRMIEEGIWDYFNGKQGKR